MNKKDFRDYLLKNIIILDGATGTQLQKRGMPQGVCPEQWVLEHPQVIIDVQREYIAAGSNAVYSCTFGGNRLKLDEFGLGDKTVAFNKRLAQLSREAAGPEGLVAGDLAPTGQFIAPLGIYTFEQVVDVYKEQVEGLLQGGVDFFVIETMMDIQEARAALIAVKESCDLPVCVSLTFNEDGRTLTGTDPVTALITLQSLGADAVGCNCSTGPQDMLKVIAAMQPYALVPLMAKPNAGLPKLIDGNTVFDMDANEFATYIKDFIELGVSLIGGCCGTSPEYIARIHEETVNLAPKAPAGAVFSAVTSARQTVTMGFRQPVTVIGERINPTGKKKLQASLREGSMDEVLDLAMEQIELGAGILDVNMGMPGIDEKLMMLKAVEDLTSMVHTPLCLDSSSPEVLEAALRIYPGRALINSISAEEIKISKLLPIAAKYGAMFVLLPLSDAGVPETAEERFRLIEQVYQEARKYGYDKQDFITDGLVMTVSSDQKAALETLKVIDWCTHTFGCNTTMGLSNVSFGLPERGWVNASFFAMAIGRGLTTAIANPSNETLMNIKLASDVLTVKDINSKNYIEHFTKKTSEPSVAKDNVPLTANEQIYEAVIKGYKERMQSLLETSLKEKMDPQHLINTLLIPAITRVGDLFEKKEYYLPQLIQSAEAMKTAFDYLEPLLMHMEEEASRKVRLVIATVKGDIHDIGKNIVGLMLKNYGFEVHDLGKDVSADAIIAKARETDAEIIGLSALMTTTMTEMKKVIALAKAEGLSCKFMVGGAVVNEAFAEEIGADGYSEDAHNAVKLAKRLAGLVE